ncbi:MAG: hypothetical protein QGF12_04890, partial [SAR202 cluster bacterium]|nr:hypothetical protein [SAR202 cluster bacterium]
KYEQFDAEQKRVQDALAPWHSKVAAVSGGYRQGKAMMAALGHPVGPTRPPTLPCTDEDIAEVREIMVELGWIK